MPQNYEQTDLIGKPLCYESDTGNTRNIEYYELENQSEHLETSQSEVDFDISDSEYAVLGESYLKNSGANIYDHCFDHIYDAAVYKRKETDVIDDYDHFTGNEVDNIYENVNSGMSYSIIV